MATATLPDIQQRLPPLWEAKLPGDARPQRPAGAWKQLAAGSGVALIAGALHGGSWLMPGTWYLVWLGQIALIALAVNSRPKVAFAYGLFTGVVGIGASFYWGIEALRLIVDTSLVPALLIYGILVAVEAITFGLFALVASLAAR